MVSLLCCEELLRLEQFPDAIAAGACPIDIHPAAGGERLLADGAKLA